MVDAVTAQIAADLRTLVARRVGVQRKVVVLGSDPALLRTLETNGCQVLADPESIDAIAAFAPAVVVAFDGFARAGDGAANFAALAAAAPLAELVFSFANAASSSALLQALVGHPPAAGLCEPDVRAWLLAAGLQIASRDVVVGPHQATGLAVDAEAQLRQLLEQLNPDAGAERLLLVARPGPVPVEVAREPGLLSVLVSTTGEPDALRATLGALGGQPQRPLQVVVATAGSVDDAERLARPAADRSAFALELVAAPSADFAVRTNLALARARGQYLAFLEAGDTVDRVHFRQLLRSLEQGTSAWTLARVQQPGTQAAPERFALPASLTIARCGLLLDRARLGPFALTFAEGIAEAEPLFLARLAALFPVAAAGGAPTAERPGRRPPFDPAALAEAMKARPLRAIGPLVLAREAGWADRWLKPR